MSGLGEMHMKEWIKKLLEDQKVVEFIRYCVVGGCAVAIHYGIYLLLNQWLAVNLAYTIGYVLSVCFHWFMTFRFSFREEITVRRTGGYLLCNGINYVLNMLFLNLFLWVGIPEQLAPVPVYCVVVPINFVLVRLAIKKLK